MRRAIPITITYRPVVNGEPAEWGSKVKAHLPLPEEPLPTEPGTMVWHGEVKGVPCVEGKGRPGFTLRVSKDDFPVVLEMDIAHVRDMVMSGEGEATAQIDLPIRI